MPRGKGMYGAPLVPPLSASVRHKGIISAHHQCLFTKAEKIAIQRQHLLHLLLFTANTCCTCSCLMRAPASFSLMRLIDVTQEYARDTSSRCVEILRRAAAAEALCLLSLSAFDDYPCVRYACWFAIDVMTSLVNM